MELLKTEDRICATAHALMMKYGIRSVSMDDIARELGISKKTIYQAYKDKDELVRRILSEEIDRHQEYCKEDCRQSENAVHEMVLAIDRISGMLEAMNPSVMYDLQKYHPAVYILFHQHKTDFLYNSFKHNIIKGIAEELYRPNINPEIMARHRVESMLIPFNPDFLRQTKASLAEAEQELLIHYLYGLVSPAGHKLVNKYLKNRKPS
jgi:AcrR family transcriptional regulator